MPRSSSSGSAVPARGAIGMEMRRRANAPSSAGVGVGGASGGQTLSGVGRGYGNRPAANPMGRTSPQVPTTSMAIAGGPRGSAAAPMASQRTPSFGAVQRPTPQQFGRDNRGCFTLSINNIITMLYKNVQCYASQVFPALHCRVRSCPGRGATWTAWWSTWWVTAPATDTR